VTDGRPGSIEPQVEFATEWILPAALGVSIYAALTLRGLFADGALVLLRLVDSGTFLADWDPPRWTAHVLQQFPAILGMRLGIDDPEPLGVLLSLGMYVVPLAFVAGSYFLLPRGHRSFFLFPLFHYLAGSQAGGFNGSAEAPVATAYFWFLLFLILFRTDGPIGRGAAVLIAIPALWLHEALALLGPLLAAAAILRLRRTDGPSPIGRTVLGALALWFAGVAAYDFYVVYARGASRDGFMLATFALGFLFAPDLEEWTLRVNVPALLGLVCAAAIAFIWWESRPGQIRPTRAALGAFAALAVALVAGTLWHGVLFSPRAQFDARSWGAVVSLPLGVLCLGSLLEPGWRAIWERRSTVALVSMLAAAQLGWQTIATDFWSSYVRDFRAVLARHEGLVPWKDALLDLPPEERWVLRRMVWDWTNPSLSFVLSPHGRVVSVIGSEGADPWHPFDPADPGDLPAGARFDTTPYRAALLRQQSAATDKQP
jgi:hypothetical protein